MVRLGCVALIALSLPVATSANPPTAGQGAEQRSFHLPRDPANFGFTAEQGFGRKQIAPNAHVGFGIFGLKSEKSALQPVTRREIDAPKQRRAGVGLSLRF